MEKIMKNWIFTMIVCILLSILTIIMVLGAIPLDGFTFARDLLHLIAAVALTLYVVFALFPLVARYRGTAQAFIIVEVVILLITVVGQACVQFFSIPILSTMQICSVLGLAMWLRGAVETVHAYLLRGTESKKKIPLWGVCCFIALSAVGVWQMAKPTIPDKYFLWLLAVLALIMAAIFGYFTAQNRVRSGATARSKAKKQAKAEKRAAEAKKAEAEKKAEEVKKAETAKQADAAAKAEARAELKAEVKAEAIAEAKAEAQAKAKKEEAEAKKPAAKKPAAKKPAAKSTAKKPTEKK